MALFKKNVPTNSEHVQLDGNTLIIPTKCINTNCNLTMDQLKKITKITINELSDLQNFIEKNSILKNILKNINTLKIHNFSLKDNYELLPNLQNIILEKNKDYYSDDGIIYSSDRSTILYCPRGRTEIEIPDHVAHVGNRAFENCKLLKKIILPEKLKTIGDFSFTNCSSLEYIFIPDTLSCDGLGFGAFNECSALKTLVLPDLVNLPKSPKKISYTCFGKDLQKPEDRYGELGINCSSLIFLKLPLRVHIETPYCYNYSFPKVFDNTNLEYILITDRSEDAYIDLFKPEGLRSWKHYLNREAEYRELIDSKYKLSVKYYKQKKPSIFKPSVLKRTDLPNKKTITEILIKNTSSIDNYAFAGLPNLEMIEIADGVEEIGTGAFAACPNLKTIILPESLKTIGPQAFACCENLESIIFSTKKKNSLPTPNIKQIGPYAFQNCTNLIDVNFLAHIKEIPQGCFKGCSSLTSITLPECLQIIGASAFDGCNLTCPRIPKSVSSVGKAAFANNRDMLHITIDGDKNNITHEPDSFGIKIPLICGKETSSQPNSLGHASIVIQPSRTNRTNRTKNNRDR